MSDYLPENELFKLIANGDEAAFAALFKLYTPKLHAFLFNKTKNEADAQELVQQTFIRIWLHKDKLCDIESPRAWIYKVAANECYNQIRSQMATRKALHAVAEHTVETDDAETPGAHILHKELQHNLDAAINALPEQRKNVYIMNRQHGMKTSEIAKVLNLSPKTVKNTLAASMKSIRSYLYNKYDYFLCLIFLFKIFF